MAIEGGKGVMLSNVLDPVYDTLHTLPCAILTAFLGGRYQ